jgi:uncharacterized protein (DUF3084 family)
MDGVLLILAIIFLGGAIATVGDRIGTRVGKARLSLFNLRPRTTAILVTILTGSIISASTLGIIFATNKELRDAVFRIRSIQEQRRKAEAELARTRQLQQKTETSLATVTADLSQARTQLQLINRNLQTAIARQQQTQAKLDQIQASYLRAQQELKQFSQQSQSLKIEVSRLAREQQQLQVERNRLLSERNQVQSRLQAVNQQKQQLETAVSLAQTQKRDVEIEIATVQTRLQQASEQRTQLIQQQQRLQAEVTNLEGSRQRLQSNVRELLYGLRLGTVSIRTGQVLAAGTFANVKDRKTSLDIIGALLRQARQNAILLAKPDQVSPEQQVILITNEDVEQLAQQLQDGQPYVVRILAAANYLQKESSVMVVPQVVRNREVLAQGDRLAMVALNPGKMTDDQIFNRLKELLALSNRRAIQAGVLADPVSGGVGEFSQIEFIKFVIALKQYPEELEVAAVVPDPVYTAGPLKLELIASRNQRIVLRSSGRN